MADAAYQSTVLPIEQHLQQQGYGGSSGMKQQSSTGGRQSQQMGMGRRQESYSMTSASSEEESRMSRGSSSRNNRTSAMGNPSKVKNHMARDPSELLVQRVKALKRLIKSSKFYFEGLAETERESARRYSRAAANIPVPIRDDHVFLPLGEHGIQDLVRSIKAVTESTSNFHAESSRSITEHTLATLDQMYNEVKTRLNRTSGNLIETHNRLVQQREMCNVEFARLAKVMETARVSPEHMETDPFLVNLDVRRQLHYRCHEEATFWKAAVAEQNSFLEFEQGLMERLKMIFKRQFEYYSRDLHLLQQNAASICLATEQLPADLEWKTYLWRHKERLVDMEGGPLRPTDIMYTYRDDPRLTVVQEGYMELQVGSGMMKQWKDFYAVLTAMGFLHLFPSGDLVNCRYPAQSIYLPECSLGALNLPELPNHAFTITSKTSNSSTRSGGNQFVFRLKSGELTNQWWQALALKARVHLVSCEVHQREDAQIHVANMNINHHSNNMTPHALSESDFEEDGNDISASGNGGGYQQQQSSMGTTSGSYAYERGSTQYQTREAQEPIIETTTTTTTIQPAGQQQDVDTATSESQPRSMSTKKSKKNKKRQGNMNPATTEQYQMNETVA
ncbi:hypothetical protein H4R35_000895 [Dimargaris xerosporica]|nr:hypothetical protein H4R35_000895 [Dimargaris xerosporica]